MNTEADSQPTASRRLILGAACGLSVAAGAAAAIGAPHPDAELIEACAKHQALLDDVNDGSAPNISDHPGYPAYEANLDLIDEAEPQTMEGVLAKARAAVIEDDREWAWHLVHDLLRLHGEA